MRDRDVAVAVAPVSVRAVSLDHRYRIHVALVHGIHARHQLALYGRGKRPRTNERQRGESSEGHVIRRLSHLSQLLMGFSQYKSTIA